MPPDPYERLQAARKAVKALQDERSALAVRLAELARGGDEDDLVAASTRLDTLPAELLRAELRLARADAHAARATLQAAEASLGALRAQAADPEVTGSGAASPAAAGPAAAGAGADWRSLEQARQARADAAAAVGPAWEALRWAGLRVARAEYELDRLVEERLATGGQPHP